MINTPQDIAIWICDMIRWEYLFPTGEKKPFLDYWDDVYITLRDMPHEHER